jgi:hypothetical protein
MVAVLDQVHKGTHIDIDRGLTFAQYLDDWMAGKLSLKSSTRMSYEHHIELYLKPGLGHVRWPTCATPTSRSSTPRCG